MDNLIKIAENACKKDIPAKKPFPNFKRGDVIRIHLIIQEAVKKHLQRFEGTVIQIRGKTPASKTFTVRKVSLGVGVERIFPFDSPIIHHIELIRCAKVRRARLFFLRGKQGRATKLRENKKRMFAILDQNTQTK